MNEFNQGYEIIAAEAYGITGTGKQERIVLGRMETKYGTMYVTWESSAKEGSEYADYFWGHYFDSEQAARADYHSRLLEHYAPAQ